MMSLELSSLRWAGTESESQFVFIAKYICTNKDLINWCKRGIKISIGIKLSEGIKSSLVLERLL